MTKQRHVISKKGMLRSSTAQWIFPGCLLVEQRDEQSVMGQSVSLFTSAHQSCSAVRYQSTAAHWAHPNSPREVWIIWSLHCCDYSVDLLCLYSLFSLWTKLAKCKTSSAFFLVMPRSHCTSASLILFYLNSSYKLFFKRSHPTHASSSWIKIQHLLQHML